MENIRVYQFYGPLPLWRLEEMFRLLILVLIMQMFCSSVFAFPNEPNGFRQYKWGMTKDKMIEVLNGDILRETPFDMPFDKENSVGVKLKSPGISGHFIYNSIYNETGRVSVSFFANKLSQVTLEIKDYDRLGPYIDKNKFKNKMVELYGEPLIEKMPFDKNAYVWRGDNTTLRLWIMPGSTALKTEASLILNIEASWLEAARENRRRERTKDKTYQGW